MQHFKEFEAVNIYNFVFCILAKIRNFKMATIFGQKKKFLKIGRVHYSETLWVENFDESTLSLTVKEIEAI